MDQKINKEEILAVVEKTIAAIKTLLVKGLGNDTGVADHFMLSEAKSFFETIMYSINQVKADIHYMKLNEEEKSMLKQMLQSLGKLAYTLEVERIQNETTLKLIAAAHYFLLDKKNKSND
jgi:hypothetical protein